MSLDILAIAAHPDDIEQTCGGTLVRMAEMGYRTGALDLTAGDMGTRGTPEQRIAESEAAAKHLLLGWRGNLRMPDARLENNIAARMTLALKIRELQPRVVILPYWQARHPDHYRAAEMGYRGLLPGRPEEAGRVFRSAPAVQDSLFQRLRRREALVRGGHQRAVRAAHGRAAQLHFAIRRRRSEGEGLFPREAEIRERLGAIARFYGNLIGVKYGEPFVVKEAIEIDDIVAMPVRSI